ncbi:eukaryotic peptide chain release factor GTP-binding subunit ERF3A-like isoform X1 [Haliotis cracherodii]|uniref:eukaryotic peptide chain release factor GTP-binding subunit ERF3A-like isoform X1 n=1 Tax=Haliotis cracherodii TaxID=6455 RepID=UPI0039ECFD08
MASQNGQDGIPDAWDENVAAGDSGNDAVNDLTKPLSSLNVNAPAFVPGKNVFAPTFVPTGPGSDEQGDSKGPDLNEEAPEGVTEKMETDAQDKGADADGNIADEWENSEEDSEQTTDKDMEPEVPVAPKPKKKPPSVSSLEPKKEHVNVVFIGHVDAGKSTIGGHLLYLTGMVDKRTLEKYEREAKEKNRETWYLSWALDTNLEEREKGKTVEVGRAFFETEKKHFTVLDAPGHKSFVPNMIGGASQADLAILVISARKGEFETGFERGGQTREHAMLVKTAGVKHLVVLINKMDDPTVEWSEVRYNECKEKLLPYLKKCGFNPKTDIYFMPCSGLTGAFLRYVVEDSLCPWFSGPSLLDYLDAMPSLDRSMDAPLRLPVVDRYRDMGTIVLGKIESGSITKNMTLAMMPNKQTVKVMQIWSDEYDVDDAMPGENVKLKLAGVEEEDVSPGFVLCPPDNPCHTGRTFDAQIVMLELKSIVCAGYSCVLHIHSASEEVTIKSLICLLDKKSGEKTQIKPRYIKQDQVGIARFEVNGGMICLESFKDFPQMGRFTLRDEGKTIAIGKVLKIRE